MLYATDIARQIGLREPFLLATRRTGEHFLARLKDAVAAANHNDVIFLSFTGIEFMDPSFTDEVLGTIGTERAQRKFIGPRLVLSDVNFDLRDNITTLLDSRPRRTRIGNCVFPVIDEKGRMDLVGPREDYIDETFRFLKRKEAITARDLQENFKLKIGAASTRLKAIYDLGLAVRSAHRDAPGGQYTYHLPL